MVPTTFADAYWTAFHRVLGEESGKVLRAMLLAKAQAHGRGAGEEWQVVHRELEEILGPQARAILALAERLHEAGGRSNGPLRGPSPRGRGGASPRRRRPGARGRR